MNCVIMVNCISEKTKTFYFGGEDRIRKGLVTFG